MKTYGKNVIFCAPAQMLEQPIREEAKAGAAILPGQVVSKASDGRFVVGAGDFSYVADKDHLAQRDVTQAYAENDIVTAFQPTSGLQVNVRAAADAAFTEGQPVYAGADGNVTTTDPADGTAVFVYAAETITVTADQPLVTVKFK